MNYDLTAWFTIWLLNMEIIEVLFLVFCAVVSFYAGYIYWKTGSLKGRDPYDKSTWNWSSYGIIFVIAISSLQKSSFVFKDDSFYDGGVYNTLDLANVLFQL